MTQRRAPAWDPPRRLPVFFDVPDVPPGPRITLRAGTSPLRLAGAVVRSGGWVAAVGCLLLVTYNTAFTLVPVALGAAIDRGVGPVTEGASASEALGEFLLWAGVVAGLYVVINLTYRFGGRMGWYCVQRAEYELSARVVERVLDVRGTAGPPQLPGRLLSVATSDASRTCSALYFAIYPLGTVVGILVATVSLFVIHPVLGLAVVVGAPLLLAVMAVVARPLRARTEREQETVADASGTAADLVAGYRVLAGIHAQRAAAAHYREVSRSALRGSLASNAAEGALIGTNAVLTGLFAGAVTVVAAVLTLDGAISVGGLVAAAGLAQLLLQPLRMLVEEAATLGAEVLASAGRVLALLGLDPHPAALGTAPVPGSPRLRITSVPLDGPVDVGRGELVALDLGAAHADALVGVLTLGSRGDDPSGPEVLLDERPLHEHDPAAVRRTVLVAPHHADLLEPTLLANVLPRPDSDPALARAALLAARCESLEQELPHGYDTRIGDGGRTLSGGQRQRVALARALARDAPVLVLHEPTNAVDAVTEHDIAERVRHARRGSTTLVLTSSPAFHAVADRSIGTSTRGVRS